MGQAKLRGSKEERVALAVSKKEEERAKRHRERQKRDQEREERIAQEWAKLSPEQREKRLRTAEQEVAIFNSADGFIGSIVEMIDHLKLK